MTDHKPSRDKGDVGTIPAPVQAQALQQPPTTKKPYARVMTDKRREQNRRAQKLFREKQRRRLTDLEDRIANTKSKFGKVTATLTPDTEQEGTPQVGEDVEEEVVTRAAKSVFEVKIQQPFKQGGPMSIDFAGIFQSNGDLPIPEGLQGILSFPVEAQSTPASIAPSREQSDPSISTYTPRTPLGSEDTESQPHSWPMPFRPQADPYNPPTPESYSSPGYAPYFAGSLSTTTRQHAYRYQRRAITSEATRSSSSSASISSRHASSTWPSNNVFSPTPQNHSAIHASLYIATLMRITRTAYLTDAPSNLPSCFMSLIKPSTPISPRNAYYPQPGFTPALAAATEYTILHNLHTNPALSLKFEEHAATVPKALRPSITQYTKAHPSYLDCIIWPRFRERAVRASINGTLDHVEFILDLFHGGIVCWGGYNTHGKAGHYANTLGWAEEVPWSTRSWEAKGWFLKKWRDLVGTEEEEAQAGEQEDGVWSSSRWWWRRREGDFVDLDDGPGNEVDTNMGVYDRTARQWAEGQVQGLNEGAWMYDLQESRNRYVPMGGWYEGDEPPPD